MDCRAGIRGRQQPNTAKVGNEAVVGKPKALCQLMKNRDYAQNPCRRVNELLILVGYGRRPENALYASGVVVLIGSLVFWDRRNLVPRDAKHSSHDYSPFWFSFDLLTPFIDLHQADTWVPRQGWWFGRNYAHLHRILGWILVPIGIAAITGIIK